MSWIVWASFIVFVLVMLAVDLGLFHGKSVKDTTKRSGTWVVFCFILGFVFSGVVYVLYDQKLLGLVSDLDGATAFQQFLTAWLLEQSLGLDNVFVFALVFSFFKIPSKLQHRVLFWGVVGALVLRGVMIALGAQFLQTFWWAQYFFAVLLLYTANSIWQKYWM